MAEDLLTLKRQLQAQGVTKEQLQAHLQGGGQPKMPQAQGIQQPDINALMTQALGRSRPVPQEALFRGLSSLTSGKVVEDSQQDTLGNDLLKTILGEKAKQAAKDPIDIELERDYKRAAADYRRGGVVGSGVERTQDVINQSKLNFQEDQAGKTRAFDFRKEFLGQKPVQQYQEMLGKGNQIDVVLSKYLTEKASGADPQSVQFTDQSLITLLNKILDPLSVVRESEYARSQEGQTLLNRYAGKIDQMFKQGGAGLTDQDRIELARVAQTLVNGAGTSYNQFLESGRQGATSFGVDPELAFSGYSNYTPMEIKDYSAMLGQSPQAGAPQAPSGQPPAVGGMFNGAKVKNVKRVR